ncbi:MAG: hypothetical protein FJX56_08045 [Alphaproteobacteria bacterium]|nr:hypothetical protein [Alphaproteobacteria bacterium]
MSTLDETSVLLEYRQVGGYVKVSALDPASHTEVSIGGDAARGAHALARLAVSRLRYVLAKQAAR